MAPSVTALAHTAFPELRADQPYHQPGDAVYRATTGRHSQVDLCSYPGSTPGRIESPRKGGSFFTRRCLLARGWHSRCRISTPSFRSRPALSYAGMRLMPVSERGL